MCGIAGILTQNGREENLDIPIQRMQQALQHRGPDDRGIFIAPDRQAAIAHTRLAILDLSSAGHQPMCTPDGRYWITFNGEIYNFRELRQIQIDRGETFHSQTDTEVILKLYQRLGSNCVQALRGMFAFAIWDDLEKTCFLARDPLGIKPLYYWQSGSSLVFASELKSILATQLPSRCLSVDGLYGYLTSGSVPEPHTLIEGIYCLEAGHWLRWHAGELSQQRYWSMDFTPATISQPEAVQIVRDALVDSIQHHFISDVPVGIFLSGGIDSTAVVALARQTQTQDVRTYSIAFEEERWNEGEVAQKVADRFGTEHTEYTMTATLGRELFPQFLKTLDQPTIDGFNSFCVSQLARKDGTRVVLSGVGGDELFGGYLSFQKVPQMVRLGKQIQGLGAIRSTVGMGLERWGTSTRTRRLGDWLQQAPTSATAYGCVRGIFSHWEACTLLQQYVGDSILPSRDRPTHLPHLPTLEDEVSFLELNRYMRNQLLRDSDVMSMSCGLELRTPLADRVLLEAIASIPSQLRLSPGKQIAIDAVPELPSWVVNRPKQPFAFPFEQWLAGEWQDLLHDFKHNRKKIPLKNWSRRWSLSILQHWLQKVSG
ncbi:MAG: asparagine synthase (glutamine-hydrolyzing) [Acaryochloridaceae cyanobacterium RU_4_10]|nr:asparagine synthase (glutamine-hydrolyzing) [Acaryochloridaceae cyanobacterium RU_4_10]